MSTEGTGHEDADGEERVDSALADDIESAFNGVVLNESGNPVASAEATGLPDSFRTTPLKADSMSSARAESTRSSPSASSCPVPSVLTWRPRRR